jgi:hypothetical protein
MTVYAFRLGVFDEMIPFDVFNAAVVHVFVRCWTVWSMYVLLLVNRTRPCCDDEEYFSKSFSFSGIPEVLLLTRCLLHRHIMYTIITCNREAEWKSPNAAAICLMCKSASIGSLSVNQSSTRSKSDIRAQYGKPQ